MKRVVFILLCFVACKVPKHISITVHEPAETLTGSGFYATAAAYNWQQRDSLALVYLRAGNLPPFLKRFARIKTSITDSATGKTSTAVYFVAKDYLSVGTAANWARICITPMAAQQIANQWHCVLPTRKMVDDIYRQATVKAEPVPMFAFRDSTPTMYQHHLMIEGQRQGKQGLIAGIKKDVVLSGKLLHDAKPNRVAIYGWHKMDGKPVQPLYTGHINWWVDYSQGIRLVYETIWVNGKPMLFKDVMAHPVYQRLLCDETWCDHVQY